MRARNRKGLGWKRGSRRWLYDELGQLPVSPLNAESAPGTMGLITLGAKQTGKPSAGNPPARFDEAGTGNVTMVEL